METAVIGECTHGNNLATCGFCRGENKQWMPEVGVWCEVAWAYLDNTVEQISLSFISDYTIVFEDKFGRERSASLENVAEFRPIATEEDIYREEQIEKIAKSFSLAGRYYDYGFLEELYDAGCRILSPNERIVKPLTDEQVDKLTEGQDLWRDDVVAVQHELGIFDEGLTDEQKEFLGSLGKW